MSGGMERLLTGYADLAMWLFGPTWDGKERELSPDLSRVLSAEQLQAMQRVDVGRRGRRWPAELTPQERRAADLVVAGHKRAAAAELMCIAATTFDTHRHAALEKLGVTNEVALFRMAIENGWLIG